MTTQKSGALEEGRGGGSYLRVPAERGSGFAVKGSSRELLAGVDAVVFDCDGVLIDARKSYDQTIRVVVEKMVEELTGTRPQLARTAPKLISTIRRTGGFNSDWDTTYALTLFSYVALGGGAKGAAAADALKNIAARFGSAQRGRGKEAVDSFLDEKFPALKRDIDRAREFLRYPETPPEGRMTTVFDELYFGSSLFRRIHGFAPSKPRAKGLIELERTLIGKRTLESLTTKLGGGRLALVTGRPSIGTEYSLGDGIMRYFDKGASMFIGDGDVDPERRGGFDVYRKPSPNALIRAKERLSSETLLYVGDSAEDLMMVQNARRRGLDGYLFAGVYQTSPVRADQAAFFEREGSDLVLENANQVPSGLLLARDGEGPRQ